MNVVGYDLCKIVGLFWASRPQGQTYMPLAAKALIERYKFAGGPKNIDELTGNQIKFTHGYFDGSAIESFEIYSDGVIVTSKSPTDLLDAFLADLMPWAEKELGLKRIETHEVSKAYESHVIFQTDVPVLSMFDVLAPIQDMLSRLTAKAMKVEAKVEVTGLMMSPDNFSISTLKPIPFRVERRAQLSFSTNYYFSSAPLPTTDHIKVLNEIEKLSKHESKPS